MGYSFLMIKPNAPAGRIITELTEVHSADIYAIRVDLIDRSLASLLYCDHVHAPYYEELIKSVTGRVVAVIVSMRGDDTVQWLRTLVGATDPAKALPHTLRAKFGKNVPYNAVHASDSSGAALHEARLFFRHSDLPAGLIEAAQNHGYDVE